MLIPVLKSRLIPRFSGKRLGQCSGLAAVVLVGGIAIAAPSQASTYGPLGQLSASQITKDSCYLRDEKGVLIDLNRLCNGSREVILPSIWVKNDPRAASSDLLISSQIPNTRITLKATRPPALICRPGFFPSQCKPPVINITGGKAAEALGALNKR